MSARRPLSLGVYALATAALAPLAPALLRARARRGAEDPQRIGERLGRPGRERPPGEVVWLHGVSVGESLSLLGLIERLREKRPAATILLTSGTRAAAEVLKARVGADALLQYAPIDTPAAVAGFLDHWRPAMAVFAESELWPNLILAARRRGTRLALVSARLSAASVRRWSRAPGAAAYLLGAFDLVLARDRASAGALAGLGAHVAGVADLKFGARPLPADPALLANVRAEIAGRPVVLAASTHPGEEALIVSAFRAATEVQRRGALLVIVPRHPGRGADIAEAVRAAGAACARRAAGEDPSGVQVWVADTLGEMGLWCRLAALAIMGGGFVPGVGGHNPLEPARLGCPIVTGPWTANWPVYDQMEARGAALRVRSGAELSQAIDRGLADGAPLAGMAGAALAFTQERDRETRRALDQVLDLLAPP